MSGEAKTHSRKSRKVGKRLRVRAFAKAIQKLD
jgi:hypothetical protein